MTSEMIVDIKNVFSCINICQVPREMLKTQGNISFGTWQMLIHVIYIIVLYSLKCMKNMALCIVIISTSTGGWTFSLIFVFQG